MCERKAKIDGKLRVLNMSQSDYEMIKFACEQDISYGSSERSDKLDASGSPTMRVKSFNLIKKAGKE